MENQSLGRYVLAEIYGCSEKLLNQVAFLEKVMVESAQKANATVLNSTFHHFAPIGVSGVVVIQESHLAIHTWPEYGFASVDIFTCGETVNPWDALEYLKTALKASHISAIEMKRGQTQMLEANSSTKINPIQPTYFSESETIKKHRRKITRELWFTERAGEIALSVKHEGNLLFDGESEFQKIQVLETKTFGRMLVLDGVIAVTDADEHILHENLVIPAFEQNLTFKTALVIGGGDGGTVRELLNFSSVEKILLAEIDPKVVEISKQFFPKVSVGLSDSKVDVKYENGYGLLNNLQLDSIDLIILDSIDSTQIEKSEMTCALAELIQKKLAPNGIATIPLGSVWMEKDEVATRKAILEEVFGESNVKTKEIHLPSFPTGSWMLAYCQKQ
ncbi:MAG: spermidine synthase [Arenicella sp.]|jgi:spermidine synthase